LDLCDHAPCAFAPVEKTAPKRETVPKETMNGPLIGVFSVGVQRSVSWPVSKAETAKGVGGKA
jgi:hypothetical protein